MMHSDPTLRNVDGRNQMRLGTQIAAWLIISAALSACGGGDGDASVSVSNASYPHATANADNMMTGALKQLFALSERYPDLKANQNFLALQEELTATEGRVAYARQFYNDSVLTYNTKLQTFPTVLFAALLKFAKRDYFEADAADRQVPKVQF